jgi:uncharacterized membrane protein YfcA
VQILGFALAAVIGLSLGLLGGGGSILTVPVFVYVLGIAAKPAIAMSLPVVGITSLIGAGMHWRLGHVKVRTALIFGIFAMAGAFAGARLAGAVSGAVQLTILAVVMLVAALSMLRRRPEGIEAGRGPARMALVVPVALVVGVLTGLVGIGGGFLIVPALALLARVPMREAVGTSLLVIALNSAAGFAGYLGSVPVDWGFMTAFAAVAVAGAFAGTAIARRISGDALRRVFGVFLILVGAFVLYMNRGVFTGSTASAARASSSLAIGAR